ncbi:MAG: RNA polymerase factor sigma-32 [Deltaproteobacteria bacterium]|nr:RNA polymerase factor sigma-32 [Deltaproteobacteria bacterium]
MAKTAKKILSDYNLDRYVSEINRYPLLTREQEIELAKKYQQNGDFDAAQQIIVSNLRFVVKIAHEYRGYNHRLLDLIQEGNIGLMIAVSKFDPNKGYRVISYAVWWIRAYIQNYIMHSWSLVKLGTTQTQRKLFFKLRSERERADHETINGNTVSTAELAERLGVNESEVINMEARLGSRDFSLDSTMPTNNQTSHLEVLSDNSPSPEEEFSSVQERQFVRNKIYKEMRHLNEKERFIIRHRLLCDDPQTLQQIGRHFRISRERVRQIEGNVLNKIRAALSVGGLNFSFAA